MQVMARGLSEKFVSIMCNGYSETNGIKLVEEGVAHLKTASGIGQFYLYYDCSQPRFTVSSESMLYACSIIAE